jgi:hypothetical protein
MMRLEAQRVIKERFVGANNATVWTRNAAIKFRHFFLLSSSSSLFFLFFFLFFYNAL